MKNLNLIIFFIMSIVTNLVYANCPTLSINDFIPIDKIFYKFKSRHRDGVVWIQENNNILTEQEISCLKLIQVTALQDSSRETTLVGDKHSGIYCKYLVPNQKGTSENFFITAHSLTNPPYPGAPETYFILTGIDISRWWKHSPKTNVGFQCEVEDDNPSKCGFIFVRPKAPTMIYSEPTSK